MPMSKRISIQGFEGSFHQLAARAFLGDDVEVITCSTFREVVKKAASNGCDGGIMAIENSIAGSILPNYALLMQSGLSIAGEIYLKIRQDLMVNPGVEMDDIREVHSHPMALLQCMDYLEKRPHWKLVETEDTALSARYIHQHRHKHVAVIAGKLASELFNLHIIAKGIQSDNTNYTRFLFVKREALHQENEQVNKASVNFHTDHSRGSLAKVLSIISDGNINLSKLQSMPIPGTEWKYSFHVDMEFDSLDQFNKVISLIKPITESIHILGIYQKGRTIQ